MLISVIIKPKPTKNTYFKCNHNPKLETALTVHSSGSKHVIIFVHHCQLKSDEGQPLSVPDFEPFVKLIS